MKACFHTIAFALLASSAPRHACALELPRMFGDGMVVQREQPVLVWGRSAPGARVEVSFDDERATSQADADGGWRVTLRARAAGGPHRLRIDDGSTARELRDVLVGDVWLASGQSNMEWTIAQSADAEAEIARSGDISLRHFKVPRSWSGTPQWQLAGGDWVTSSPATAGAFSAVAHFFARALRESQQVPIGIIDSSWGGSSIEAWTDAATQGIDAATLAQSAERLRQDDTEALRRTRANLARWPVPVDDSHWHARAFDDASWADIAVPGLWEGDGWNGMDGVAWYRIGIELTAFEAAQGITLGLGRIDDSDTAWVNGIEVGSTQQRYNQPRVYTVPASALRAGDNRIALRATDTGGGGGIHGESDELYLQLADGTRRALPARWKFRPAQVSALALDDDKNQRATLLYNAMIHPLQPFPLRGVIWYQGESNAGSVAQALHYREQFPALITQWRSQWNAPQLPFLWVQLASFGSGNDRGDERPWSLLRESQGAALALPATAQVVSIDIGDVNDIHPRNKQEVGRRLVLAARNVAYGEAIAYRGPVLESASFRREVARLSFDSALATRDDGPLLGFELAGRDGVFHAASATIDGTQVRVRSDTVARPVAVRYGWKDAPVDASLVDGQGLPAAPFRHPAEPVR